jgi:branched-subunit amino acid ABC-type transport system permease component
MTQVIVDGLLQGAGWALLGLGYTLVFGVMHLLTLAHGAVFVAAGVIALTMSGAGTPIWLIAVYAVAVGAALSALTDYVSFRATGYDRPIAAAVSTIGYAVVVQETVVAIRGSEIAVALPFDLPRADVELGGLLLSGARLATLAVAAVVLVATSRFVRRSRWGMAMRAFSRDPHMVGLLGVPVRRLTLITLLVAGALAGLASILEVVRIGSVTPRAGLEVGLTGLAIMTIGGLGSLHGAMVAGLGLGLADALAAYYGFFGYEDALLWLLLIAVLLVRPQGLAARAAE